MIAPAALRSLSQAECTARLAAGCVGRVGLISRGQLHVLPVNYAADSRGEVLYRTLSSSPLATVDGNSVVFEIDGYDERLKSGWSVCVHGIAREVQSPQSSAAERLAEHPVLRWAPGPQDRWFAIAPHELTGRQIPMTDAVDHGGWIEGVVS